MTSADIAALRREAEGFRATIAEAKRATGPSELWYPYDTVGNLNHIAELLDGDHGSLLDPERSPVVADVGGADGDMGFLLASRGTVVDLIDHGPTNHNGLEGARRLNRHFGDPISIVDVDLDHHFELPRPRYDLVLFLGILYHLKNPYNALECLARSARHCLLSTRITEYAADRVTRIGRVSAAYLLAPDECNNDATNYWIFTEPGLRRLVVRTGWEVLEWLSVGDIESDPASADHDQRAFCLLRSRVA